VDPIYPRFAMADSVFYDSPAAGSKPEATYSPSASREWADWDCVEDDIWRYWRHREAVISEQGWKIHVSATPRTAASVLSAASTYFHDARIPFKFLRNEEQLGRMLSKDADRSSSGKFIAAYPASPEHLRSALFELDARIGGREAPYILSDLRWQRGPVHVRYGGFVKRTLVLDGVEMHAIRNPRTGELEEDVRSPRFAPPAWVEVPDFLREHVEDLSRIEPPRGFPEVTGVLHHSNAGGVYDALMGGVPVVLKEARPFVGYTPDGRDALSRLAHEERVLRSLDERWAPRVYRAFESHGHRFLAMQKADGQPLNRAVVERHPLVRAATSRKDRDAYRVWALRVLRNISLAVTALHSAGWTHGDIHPGNIHVREDGSVTLLDFEMARPVADPAAAVIGAAGFVAPDGRAGVRADDYSLACIALFLFLPLTPLLRLHPEKADELVQEAAQQFELGQDWQNDLRRRLAYDESRHVQSRRPDRAATRPAAASTNDRIRGIADALAADATYGRTDRLWAGDPAQFAESPLSIAHGAAGVCLATHYAGYAVPRRTLRWLERAWTARRNASRVGLFDGVAGFAWTMRTLGQDQLADAAFKELENVDLGGLGPDFHSGLAGIGLVLLSEVQRGGASDRLDQIVRLLGDYWTDRPAPTRVPTGSGGLLRGGSGTALFALRHFEHSGDPASLALAERCVEHDLASLAPGPDASLQVNEGWRLLPYLASGSAGIGAVLLQLMRYSRRMQRHEKALTGIVRAACAPFVIQAGLFDGRAGLVQFLLLVEQSGRGNQASRNALTRHAEKFALHAIQRPIGVGYAGDALLRVSHDLATGSAGVLTALASIADLDARRDPAWLGMPFLTPPERSRSCVAADRQKGGDIHGLSSVASGARTSGS
jgi:serine/threonine protein kinase